MSIESLARVCVGSLIWRAFDPIVALCVRIIYGIGLGLSLRCGPMYLKETVTASFKDAATVSVKLSMVVGMITSYIVGAVIDTTVFGERGPLLKLNMT